jgi:hypothetical protein
MSDGQKIVFARSEVPEQFASASKSEQIDIIKTGTLCHFTVEAKLRSEIKDADYEKYTELGRQQKKDELQPMIDSSQGRISSLIATKSQLERDIKDKDENFKELLKEKTTEFELNIKYRLQQQFELDLQAERNRIHEDKMKEIDTIRKQHSNDEKKLVELETTLKYINSQGTTVSILVEENKELKEQLKSLQEVKLTPNSQHLGAVGEEDARSILEEAMSDIKSEIKDIHSAGHEADFGVDAINSKNDVINFKVDSKESSKDGNRIKTEECEKLKRDVDGRVQCRFGILIAHRGKIDGKIGHLTIERSPQNKVIVYLCWLGMTRAQKVESLRDVVSMLIELVSLNENNHEQQERLQNTITYLKRKNLSHIKDAEMMATDEHKLWQKAKKNWEKLVKVSESTELIDSESDDEVIKEAKQPKKAGRKPKN